MNNIERYQQIIDEAYENYVKETMFDSNPKWLEPIPVMNMTSGEKSMGARQYFKDGFVNKCKTDYEFGKKWGLMIEEKEMSLSNEINVYYRPKASAEFIEVKFIILPTGKTLEDNE